MSISKYKLIPFILNLFLTFLLFNDGKKYPPGEKSSSDEEDASHSTNKIIQSSGDGFIRPPDVYPSLDPYSKATSSSTILVDVAFEHTYESYMLPGSAVTQQLRSFKHEVIENFKIELQTVNSKVEYRIISLRPGPLIPKRSSSISSNEGSPSVFIRMNITEQNTSIVNPLIMFHISQCGRKGILGNSSISEQIVFPLYTCTEMQVFCFPECRNGAYCDGIIDCPETKFDESSSCPRCLYKDVSLITNTQVINEDEELVLKCNFNERCEDLKNKIQWNFPLQLKSYEQNYKGNETVDSLPRNLIISGLYRCTIDGESSSANISVFQKPTVMLSKGDIEAETVIISEIEGQNVEYWCNTTEGFAAWFPVDKEGITIINHNKSSSKISFKEVTKAMATSYYCQVLWGFQKRKVINKSIRMVVLCDMLLQFECKLKSSQRSCIPIHQKCDTIKQCSDGSDELDCNFCSEKELSVNLGKNIIIDEGDTLIMDCLTTKKTCKPLSWWKDGSIISNGGNMARFRDSLFIVNLNLNYSGIYQCSDATHNAIIDVHVHVNPEPKVRVSPSLRVINVTYGQAFVLNCYVDHAINLSNNESVPCWTKDNKNILDPDIDVLSKSQTFSKLSIKDADFKMSGVYTCKVTWGVNNRKVVRVATKMNINPLICEYGEKICEDNKMCLTEAFWCDGKIQCQDGSDEKSCDRCSNGYVFVQPSVITVLVGQTVELHCYYDKDCFPTKWRILNEKRPLISVEKMSIESNKLVLRKVTLDSSKIYECYSGTKISQANVTVIRQVEIKLSSTYAFVNYGQDINIECQSNYGQPRWRRRDLKSLAEIKGAHQLQPNSNTATLFIHSPSYDSKGYYTCFVRLSQSDEDAASSLMFVYVHDLKCPQNHMMCDGNTRCIPNSKLCDLVNDCVSGEDELNCSKCKHDLEIQPKILTITTDGYDIFRCIVPNKDCLPIEWKSKSTNSSLNSSFYNFDDSLYILRPKLSDSGEIMCISGQKSSSALLIVKDLLLFFEPHHSDKSTIYIGRGESLRISCKSNIGKPNWIYPEESSVSQFGIRYINYKEKLTVLDIINIQSGASRTYVCYVSFSRENKKISVTIKVI